MTRNSRSPQIFNVVIVGQQGRLAYEALLLPPLCAIPARSSKAAC